MIPLGGHFITRDLTTLQLTEAEAERMKTDYGKAIAEKEDEEKMIPVSIEGSTEKEIGEYELNLVVEARVKEIVENVCHCLETVVDMSSLGAGIILAGCASNLDKLPDVVAERSKNKVRFSALRRGLIQNADAMTGDPLYMNVLALLTKGTESCVEYPFTGGNLFGETEETPESPKPEPEKPKERKPKGPGLFGRLKKGIEQGMTNMFDEG